jgi:hypothetical protein
MSIAIVAAVIDRRYNEPGWEGWEGWEEWHKWFCPISNR